MPVVDVYNMSKKKVESLELAPEVFGVEVKEHLFHAVVRQQLANRRAGTHKVKTRSEVRGGGRKPFKQKGTGRARAGTTRAAQWRGGGVVFGPTPRDHGHKINKKVRRSALKSALSRRTEEGAITVLDQFALEQPKTRDVVKFLEAFELDSCLVVVPEVDTNVALSTRNIQGAMVIPVAGLNVYDILRHKNLLVTKDAVEAITARLGS
jgi:large subunit ribosomal protein L4